MKENLIETPPSQPVNVEKREMKDKFWISAPVIEILCILAFPIYTIIDFFIIKDGMQNSKTLYFSNYYNLLWMLPLPIILLSYLYLCLICAIRSNLFQIFLFVHIISLVLYSTIMIVFLRLYGILVSAISVSLFLCYFFCLKRNIKLAALTTKAALEIFSNIKGRLVLSMSYIISIFGLLLAFFIIASLMVVDMENLYDSTGKNVHRDVLYSLLPLSAIGLLFFIGVCTAVLYLFGAALFNQKSLQDYSSSPGLSTPSEKKDSAGESLVFYNLAGDIAFRSSFGVACFGSVILSTVKLLRIVAQDSSRKSNGGVDIAASCMSMILQCIEEFVDYLTSSAYIYSALYGTSLIESGKMGWKSYKNKGWERYFSFSIVENILSFTSFLFCLTFGFVIFFIISLSTVGISFEEYTKKEKVKLEIISVFSLGLFIALTVACLFTNQLVGGASTCQLSIYVEDPLRFENTYVDFSKFKELLGDVNE